jgi:cell division protein FtsL
MKARFLLYFLVLTLPLCLGAVIWQTNRYTELEWETARLETVQEEWVESNNQLIAGIAVLSSSERIENIARNHLGLTKKSPEEVLQIRIEGGPGLDG